VYKPAACNRLYIEFKGSAPIATGLPATEENKAIAIEMLWILWRRANGLEQVVQPVAHPTHVAAPDDVLAEEPRRTKKPKRVTPNEA